VFDNLHLGTNTYIILALQLHFSDDIEFRNLIQIVRENPSQRREKGSLLSTAFYWINTKKMYQKDGKEAGGKLKRLYGTKDASHSDIKETICIAFSIRNASKVETSWL